jgi:CubicO group peptidase (beta-lactamase class C family)
MKKIIAVIVFALFLGSCTVMSFAQQASRSEAQRHLDERMPIWLKAFNVTGVAVAYIENGQLAWTAFYGDQVPGGLPANSKTLYNVASLTKPITAELILRLASAGKLSLDEPISPYWIDPDLKENPWTKLLTPRICLTHQTGFPNWRYQTNNVLKFQFQPGTAYGYSGEGYDYVARFAERKTGRPFEELVQQYVFDPIGMTNTSYTPRPWWNGRQAKPVESEPRTKWSAADLLRTTVEDYARFVISVMHNEGVSKAIAVERLRISRNLTTPESQSVLCELAKDPGGCTVSIGSGLGWRITEISGETIVDHTGADSDVKTFAFFIPQRQIGAVIFTDGPDVGHQMIDKVLETLYPNPLFDAAVWQ